MFTNTHVIIGIFNSADLFTTLQDGEEKADLSGWLPNKAKECLYCRKRVGKRNGAIGGQYQCQAPFPRMVDLC